jgi:excisionase family DNA binding protein
MALLNSSQAARLLGISKSTLQKLVSQGVGPKMAERTASNCYRFLREDLDWFKIQRGVAAASKGIRVYRNGALV